MNKKLLPFVIFGSIALGYALAVLILSGQKINQNNQSKNKINKLIEYINRDYFEDVKTDSIVDLTVNEILAKLDPHSVYINSSEAVVSQDQMRGDFVGIGINFYQHKDTVAVIKNVKGGPAELAGIQSGDRILFAEKKKLFGAKIAQDTLFKYLKGEVDSKVNLTIYRKSENKKFVAKLTRNVVPIKSVETAILISEKTGYIKVSRFAESTYAEFKTALDKLLKQKIDQLVIDLRDNTGGYLEIANQMVDEFLDEKKIIVKIKNKNGQVDTAYATNKGAFLKGRLFVLVNENSASASEVFAGAIQDNDRGTIIGRKTFGKGLVQKEMPLGDGSLVRLTIAKYYTPSGRSIQKPYENGKSEDYYNFHAFSNKELFYKDSIKVYDSLKYKTLKGRTVYGGGGIMPDIFVPLNRKFETDHVLMMLNSPIFSYFIFEYLDKNRKQFNKYKLNQIKEEVYKNDKLFNDFVQYTANNQANILKTIKDNEAYFQHQLYAEMVRQLLNDDLYYKILLEKDDMMAQIK
jgi:carboxyl-terminal processing protease